MDIFREREVCSPNKKELWIGLLCWLMYLLGFSLLLSQFDSFFRGERGELLFNIAFYACNFLLIMCVYRRFLWRSRCRIGLLLASALRGYLAYYALSAVMAMLLALSPLQPVNPNQEAVELYLQTDIYAYGMVVVVLAPIVEEVLVRGLVFAPLCRKSPLLGYVVSMGLFSFLHIMSYIGMEGQTLSSLLYSFLQYLPAGFVFCWTYQRTQSILGPIVLHGLSNLISIFAIMGGG